ncbi:MAG: indolepyruvate ferredoxin oxidoreductase subunit alpha [Actinobacteria bacterium RBG_16_64_13]|nr:MAG: indolepyruvate ferredoxin oxidoreductase subunit alpha [Actinobacteria bacterium RBG_16_64_13]
MTSKVETKEAVEILSGNEAIARGAWEAGVKLAAAYPGTPSTEILESLAEYEDVYCEWSPNEKVAMEVGIGASMAGGRALVCMKHVGLNVAADPFFSSAYVGLEAGMVVVSADDPGMHSSQDEQDNRNYAKFARVPLLEPSDSGEAKEFMVAAYDLSERFDTPVLFRTTTRTSHSQSLVKVGERVETAPVTQLKRNWTKYLMMPANAMVRHPIIEQRVRDLAVYAESSPFNRVEMGDPRVGIITSGAIYGYCREAVPGASFLKLGMTHPLPAKLIAGFRSRVEKLYVVEELDPFLEEAIRLLGIKLDGGKELNTLLGELNARYVAQSLAKAGVPGVNPELLTDLGPVAADLPGRPPTFCPGCSHRGIYVVLKKMKAFVSGDIGCYTMGALPPYNAVHCSTCMGASLSMAHGMTKVMEPLAEGAPVDIRNKPIGIIGDSTFFHSGITSLMDVVYNRGNTLNIIVDNSTTAMTGGQENPGTGKTLLGEPSETVDIPALCRAIGIKRVTTIDPYNLDEVERVLREELAANEPSVVIAGAPCVLQFKIRHPVYQIDSELCTGCKRCLQAGCGALNLYEDAAGDRKVEIMPDQCTGCGVCSQLCRENAITRPEPAEGRGS